MKNTLSIASILLSCCIIYSCSKTGSKSIQEEENISSQPSVENITNPLLTDTNFIRLANITYDFGEFIKGVVDEQQLNLDTVQAQMQLISTSATRQEQLVEINDIFTVDISTELEAYITEFDDRFETLTTEYGDIFSLGYEDATLEAIKHKLPEGGGDVTIQGCGWRYSLCVGAATAGAILCHAACVTAAAATAGLAAPLCVGACITVQVWAGVQCYDNYCD